MTSCPPIGRRRGIPTAAALLLLAAVLVPAPAPAQPAGGVVRLEGLVTAAGPRTVTVNLGARDGLRVGDEGTVSHDEPDAGGGHRRVNVARIRITAVRADGAEGTVVQAVDSLRPGQRATFLFRAGPACAGTLRVTSVPPGAAVSVDGVSMDGPTPMVVKGVPCGDRAVALALAGHEEVRRVVTVRPGAVQAVAVDLVPAAPAGTPGPAAGGDGAPADVVLRTFGYEGIGGLQGLLSLGLLASQYAVEVNDRLVLGWNIRSGEATVALSPGRHRLRVLIRHWLSRAPMPVHDGTFEVRAGGPNEARINFLVSLISVNGDWEAFNRLPPR
jgi:hypothetical protein